MTWSHYVPSAARSRQTCYSVREAARHAGSVAWALLGPRLWGKVGVGEGRVLLRLVGPQAAWSPES